MSNAELIIRLERLDEIEHYCQDLVMDMQVHTLTATLCGSVGPINLVP